jgi:hypothetical protein
LVALELIAEEKEPGVAALASVLSELASLRAAIQNSTLLRPWVTVWRAIDWSLQKIESVISSYLLALAADTPDSAEAFAREAQQHLDAASDAARAFSELLDNWSDMDNSSPDPVDGWPSLARAAFNKAGSSDIVQLDRRGGQIFAEITGDDEAPVGLGLLLQMVDVPASVMLDRSAFISKAQTAFRELVRQPERLGSLQATELWRTRLEIAIRELRDIGTEIAILSSAVVPDRFEARSWIRLGARLVEPISKPLLTPLLVARGRDITRVLRFDINTLINQVIDKNLSSLVEGFEIGLRDADAHHEYLDNGDHVVLTSPRTQISSLTNPELADLVLTGLETLNALNVGLVLAAATTGTPVDELPGAASIELDPNQNITLALGASGWSNVEARVEASKLTVKGVGRFPSHALTLAGMCMPYIDPSVTWFELVGTFGDSTTSIEGPLGPYRSRSSTEDEWLRDIYFIEGGALWTQDSSPVFDQNRVRKWVAMKSAEALKSASVVSKLSSLEQLAKRLADPELARSVAAARRLFQAQSSNRPSRAEDMRDLALIEYWEKTRL